jgi:serine/threonine protein kinase
VLLYELVHGHAPFRGESVSEVKQSMLQGTYELSDGLSEGLKELITNILKFDPKERMSLKNILSCDWIKKMQEIVVKCAEDI